MGFLKVLQDGSHMIMMECPEAVNTLLHEFFLWEPAAPPPPKKENKTRPETAKAQSDNTKATTDPSQVRPATARQTSSNGGAGEKANSKDKKWLKINAAASSGCHSMSWMMSHFMGPDNLRRFQLLNLMLSQKNLFIWNGPVTGWTRESATRYRGFTNDSRSVSCWAEGQRSCPCPHHRAVEDTAVPLSGGWRRSQDRRSTDGKDKVDNGKILEQKKWQRMTFADKSKCHLLYCKRHIRKDNTWLPGWTFDIPWMWRRKAKEMVCMKHAPGCVTLPYLKRQQSLNLRENSYMLHFPNVWGRYWCIYVYIRRCL